MRRRRQEEDVQLWKIEHSQKSSTPPQVDFMPEDDITGIEMKCDPYQRGKYNLQSMLASIYSKNINMVFQATQSFRKMLSNEPDPPIQEIINLGIVPKLVELLKWQNDSLQFEAAWTLTNIASGTSVQTAVVLHAGAVPALIELLSNSNDDIQNQSVWALGNIAGDSASNRDYILNHNILPPLLQLIANAQKLLLMRNAAWTLSNLFRGKDPLPDLRILSVALPTLVGLIYAEDDEVVADACWALSYLTDGPNERIQKIIELGVCQRFVELLQHYSVTVRTAAIRAVGNMVTSNDSQTQVIIEYSALLNLSSLLDSTQETTMKEICWTISNITAGNVTQIQAVIDANIIPKLISVTSSSDYDIQQEIIWVITNATIGGNEQQIRCIADQGAIMLLCEMLAVKDTKIVDVALTGLENILRIGERIAKVEGCHNPYATQVEEIGGIEKMNVLQRYENQTLYEKACNIIDKYFQVDEANN